MRWLVVTLKTTSTISLTNAHRYPDNRHIRDKIRQQLQILRDLGLLQFLRPAHYRLL